MEFALTSLPSLRSVPLGTKQSVGPAKERAAKPDSRMKKTDSLDMAMVVR